MSLVDDKVCCETDPLQFVSIAYDSTKQKILIRAILFVTVLDPNVKY